MWKGFHGLGTSRHARGGSTSQGVPRAPTGPTGCTLARLAGEAPSSRKKPSRAPRSPGEALLAGTGHQAGERLQRPPIARGEHAGRGVMYEFAPSLGLIGRQGRGRLADRAAGFRRGAGRADRSGSRRSGSATRPACGDMGHLGENLIVPQNSPVRAGLGQGEGGAIPEFQECRINGLGPPARSHFANGKIAPSDSSASADMRPRRRPLRAIAAQEVRERSATTGCAPPRLLPSSPLRGCTPPVRADTSPRSGLWRSTPPLAWPQPSHRRRARPRSRSEKGRHERGLRRSLGCLASLSPHPKAPGRGVGFAAGQRRHGRHARRH